VLCCKAKGLVVSTFNQCVVDLDWDVQMIAGDEF